MMFSANAVFTLPLDSDTNDSENHDEDNTAQDTDTADDTYREDPWWNAWHADLTPTLLAIPSLPTGYLSPQNNTHINTDNTTLPPQTYLAVEELALRATKETPPTVKLTRWAMTHPSLVPSKERK